MRREFIPVSAPVLTGNEKAYVLDCLESGWISSAGDYVKRFESSFAEFCGTKHAVACCNGTAALHLALLALGVAHGDEVIIPTLSFVSTANAVRYCGAQPVLIDSDSETWNLNPDLLEAKINHRTKGIIVVHLLGHPADMDAVLSIARRHGLFVVEDAAEAHGAEYKNKRAGSLADIATFSLYANKIITSGDGGMVVTNNALMVRTIHQLRDYGADPGRRYWFPIIGYNYRMMNVAAAIGLAQLERVKWHTERRQEVASWYREKLGGVSELEYQREKEWARHAYWMFTVILGDEVSLSRDEVIAHLQTRGIESRPVVYPIHMLPPYRYLAGQAAYPVADRVAQKGLSLPTWAGLSRDDVSYVCDSLIHCLIRSPQMLHT